jgi:hypothetical protein
MKEGIQKRVHEIQENGWTVKWIQWELKETSEWIKRRYKQKGEWTQEGYK